jgi:hypothetical protein
MEEQAWINEVQKIVGEFVQNDHDLGELMLDHSQPYWDACFYDGLTPQQALDEFLAKHSDRLAIYKRFKRRRDDDSWWLFRLQALFIKLSTLNPATRESREVRAEVDALIKAIIARYRRSRDEPPAAV